MGYARLAAIARWFPPRGLAPNQGTESDWHAPGLALPPPDPATGGDCGALARGAGHAVITSRGIAAAGGGIRHRPHTAGAALLRSLPAPYARRYVQGPLPSVSLAPVRCFGPPAPIEARGGAGIP